VNRSLTDPDLSDVKVLLCDGDGNLYPSEEPAFEAACEVINELMEAVGSDRRFESEELRREATGKNFRSIATDLVADAGCPPLAAEDLERWVREEVERVTEHLRMWLRPDAAVSGPLRRLAHSYELAVVTSSAAARLDASLDATRMGTLFPAALRFSAEDSLDSPKSKPDPAIYAYALESLGVRPEQTLAIEDSRPGVESATGAGIATVGNVVFVPEDEREARIRELREAGAFYVVESWSEFAEMLERAGRASRTAGVGA